MHLQSPRELAVRGRRVMAVLWRSQFTKCDKKKKGGDIEKNIEAFKKELLKDWEYLPPCVVTSSQKGIGKNKLLSLLAQLRDLFNSNRSP